MSRRRRIGRPARCGSVPAIVAALALAVLVGCSEKTSEFFQPIPEGFTVTVTPAGPRLGIGEQVQLQATQALEVSGPVDVTALATWTSGDEAVAAVDVAGLVTGIADGTALVTAEFGGESGSTSVTVASLVSIAVTPSDTTIRVGETADFTARGTWTDDVTLDISDIVAWTTSDPSVAVVGGAGAATAVGVGVTTVTASRDGIEASANLTVTPAAPVEEPRFAYAAAAEAGEVVRFSVDPATGALAGEGAVTAPVGTRTIVAAPDFRFVYAGSFDAGTVSAWAVSPADGSLTEIAGSPFDVTSGTDGVGRIAMDPTGSTLFVLDVTANEISSWTLDPGTGGLTAAGLVAGSVGTVPEDLAVEGLGRWLYVTTRSGLLQRFEVGTGGTLAASGETDLAAWGVAADRAGTRAFTVGGALGDAATSWTIDAGSGDLTLAGAEATGSFPARVTAHPAGTFLYVVNVLDPSVSGFAIDPTTGALSALTGSPWPLSGDPGSATIDPYGRFLYVAIEGPPGGPSAIDGFAVDAIDGTLTPVPDAPASSANGTVEVTVIGPPVD